MSQRRPTRDEWASCRHAAACLLLMSTLATPLRAQVLFEGSLDTRPDQQSWAFLTDPVGGGSVDRLVEDGATTLETTIVESDKAGWFANLPPFPRHPRLPLLDRSRGYTVTWTVRLDAETRSTMHRAGLSVIVLSSDLKGVELGFWADEAWVQTDDPLFNHGEGAALDTTAARIEYELCVLGDSYRLRAGGAPLFEGQLRDYSAFGSPYDVPNFLFVGDDTSSASARFEWERLEVEIEACDCNRTPGDRDGDGVADCADDCPDDPGKSVPGDCGCGFPDLDRDGDTLADCAIVAGDLYPDGLGDEAVGLADFLLAHRKLALQDLPIGPWDLLVGDLSPDEIACRRPNARRRACPAADGLLDAGDGRRIRALVADRLELSCEPCTDPPAAPGNLLRRPGDVAPRTEGGDGSVGVADTVLALRWAVDLDGPPSPEELLRGDVSPHLIDGGLSVVTGDGQVDVADVVLILRAAVHLTDLAGPARGVHADLLDATEALVFSVTVSDWPASATPAGASSAHCPAGGIGGLDAVADQWTLTCASDPGLVSGPARLGTLRYRAPEPVDPGTLSADLRLLDADLAVGAGSVAIVTD